MRSEPTDARVQIHVAAGVAVFDLGAHAFDIGIDLEAKARLLHRMHEAESDPSVRALLVTATGSAFGGAEYRRFLRRVGGDTAADGDLLAAREERALDQLLLAIDACPKLTAIGLHGEVAGPFVGLSLAFDVRLAAPHAIIDLGPVDGAPPAGGLGFFLPQCLGLGRARELVLRRTRLLAAAALDLGLVSEVVGAGLDATGFIGACIAATAHLAALHGAKPVLRPYTRDELEDFLEREALGLHRAWRRGGVAAS